MEEKDALLLAESLYNEPFPPQSYVEMAERAIRDGYGHKNTFKEYWVSQFLQELVDLKSYVNITSRSENAMTKSDKIDELIKKYREIW